MPVLLGLQSSLSILDTYTQRLIISREQVVENCCSERASAAA